MRGRHDAPRGAHHVGDEDEALRRGEEALEARRKIEERALALIGSCESMNEHEKAYWAEYVPHVKDLVSLIGKFFAPSDALEHVRKFFPSASEMSDQDRMAHLEKGKTILEEICAR